MYINLGKIAEYTGGKLHGDENSVVTNAVIDSRKTQEGSLFAALKGENTDGHRFVETAFNSGATAALVEYGFSAPENAKNYVEVENTQNAMGDIAAGILKDRGNSVTKVAVTGSVGKTSTKDMIAHVFSTYRNTLKSELNQNNELGLPLTVMKLKDEHEVLICEMGMRGLGQIEYLANIVKPDIAVITNIGVAHLELLKTRENILRAKLEIYKGMGENGVLILNGDNDMLSDKKCVCEILQEYGISCPKIVYFGTESNSDYRAENIHGSNYVLITPDGSKFEIRLKVPGVHNVYNSMAAVCAANAAGISTEKAVEALLNFGDDVSRQKIIEKSWGYIIDDAYNAGPESMEASLGVLKELKADVKVAALGDMLELGDITQEAHRKVGKIASESADVLLAVGCNSVLYYDAFSGKNKFRAENSAQGAEIICEKIKDYIREGKRIAVLAKGSNAMKMNVVSEALQLLDTEDFV